MAAYDEYEDGVVNDSGVLVLADDKKYARDFIKELFDNAVYVDHIWFMYSRSGTHTVMNAICFDDAGNEFECIATYTFKFPVVPHPTARWWVLDSIDILNKLPRGFAPKGIR